MKYYYWIVSQLKSNWQDTKNTLCACKMKGEGNMLLNNVNVGNQYCRFVNCHCFSYLKILEKKKLVVRYLSSYSAMSKSKPYTLCHLKAIVSECGDDIFSMDSKILFCKICEIKVAAKRIFTVQQHVGREKHIRAMQLASKKQHP
jgi:hypothetical protein